jgi:hypothetical protein
VVQAVALGVDGDLGGGGQRARSLGQRGRVADPVDGDG